MLRRLVVSIVLVSAGFAAGLVLTGRMRTASESRADVDAVVQTPATRPAAAPAAAPSSAVNAGPDFTRVAAQAVKGVANISSITVVRQRQIVAVPGR